MRSTELQNHQIQVGQGQVTKPAENGEGPSSIDVWRIDLIDPQTGDRTWFILTEEAKNELIAQLTGGIVLAGGKFPKLP